MSTIPLKTAHPDWQSVTFKRRVPLAVHMLYKSTQTGSITKSGQSSGPLSSFKVRFVLFFRYTARVCLLGLATLCKVFWVTLHYLKVGSLWLLKEVLLRLLILWLCLFLTRMLATGALSLLS